MVGRNFWEAIVCADVRCREVWVSWRSVRSLRRGECGDLGVWMWMSRRVYVWLDTKKERKKQRNRNITLLRPVVPLIHNR